MSVSTVEAMLLSGVGEYPGIGTRLIGGVSGRENLADYRAAGGYAPVADVEAWLEEIDVAGLRGRGGAAFPTGRKLRSVRAGAAMPVVVANGEEGEPASVKDRWLMRQRPHLVLDGLRLAALAVGTADVHVYVSDQPSAESIEAALAELEGESVWELKCSVMQVDSTYVAGEETAAVQAINGGPALPMDKPPRPFIEGVESRPTLISNVETLANLPIVRRLGSQGYRDVGTATSPGTFLMTLTRPNRADLYEVPFGLTLDEMLTWIGFDPSAVAGVLVGGYFAGVRGRQFLETPLDYDAVAAIGSGLGCGAMVLLDDETCPVEVSARVMAYFARENAGQCGSCFNGTSAMSAVLNGLLDHQTSGSDVQRLRDWSVNLRGRGACGTLDGATNIAASVLSEFPAAIEDHLNSQCAVCESGRSVADRPFAVAIPSVLA